MGYPHKGLVGFAWALLAFAAAPVSAQTHPVTIAWDASADPAVNGYIVYVGTEPGAPTEHFELTGTSFVYPHAADGRPYFFSVAASSTEHLVGSRSDEVMFFGGGAVMSSSRAAVVGLNEPAPPESEKPGAQSAHSGEALPQQFCLGGSAAQCYVPAGSLGDFGEIESLKALGDGRLIFVENGSRIVIENPASHEATVATTVMDESVRFVSIAIDPEFNTSRLIYVGEVDSSADGTARLDVARYRELEGRLGERAVLISSLPVLRDANVRVAVDGAHHLFVALPGALLRYQSDGSVPQENHAMSPVYARGVNGPEAVEWDARSNSLWIGERSRALQRLRLNQDGAEWPRPLETMAIQTDRGDVDSDVRAIALSADAAQVFVVAGRPAALFEATQDTRGALRLTPTALSSLVLDGEPTAAVFNQGELDVAIRRTDAKMRILRFRQAPAIR